jgi:hypothetical protein
MGAAGAAMKAVRAGPQQPKGANSPSRRPILRPNQDKTAEIRADEEYLPKVRNLLFRIGRGW